MAKRFARPGLLGLAAALCLVSALSVPAQPVHGEKRVLVIYMDDHIRPYTVELDRAIRQTFEGVPSGRIDFYSEVVDLDRFPSDAYEDTEARFLKAKYAARAPDLLMACGTPAANFVLSRRASLFPGVPIVFCLVASEELGEGRLMPGVTGIVSNSKEAIRGTLDFAFRLHPATRHVVYVTGTSVVERAALARARAIFAEYRSRADFTYFTGLPLDELAKRAAELAPDSVILFHSLSLDREGRAHTSVAVMDRLRKVVKVPIYGTYDLALGHGMVGGFMPTFDATGHHAAQLALKVLGLPPGSPLPPVEEESLTPIFDGRELRRWHISDADLPFGSSVLFREKPIWRARPWLALGTLAVILAESLLVVALVLQLLRRRQAEARALEEGRRLALAVETAKLGIWEWRADGDQLRAPPEVLQMHGMQDLPHPRLGDGEQFVHPDDRPRLAEAREGARRAPGRYDVEFRVLRPDGSIRWLSVTGASFAGPTGKVDRLVAATIDVTERKGAEERLRLSEERYRAFITYSTEGVCRYETDEAIPVSLPDEEQVDRMFNLAYVAECNEAFARMFGRASAREMVGARLGDLLPRSDPRNVEYLLGFIRSGYQMLEARSYKTDLQGNILCIASSATGAVEEGSLVRVWSIQRDITERLRAEAALAESEARYRSLFEQSPIGIYRTTPDGKILAANPTLIHKLGYASLEEMAGRNLEAEGYAPLYPREEFKRRLDREGEIRGFEAAWTTKSGARLEVRESARAIRDSEGRVLYYEGTAEDVTEQRRAERALGESETRYRDLFEAAMDGMAVAEAKTGILVECNAALQALVGRTREELVGQPQAILHPPQRLVDGVTESFAFRRRQPSGEPIENRVQHKDGSVRDVEIKAAPFETGGRPHMLGIFRDVTERKRAEAALGESQAQLVALVESTNDLIWSVDARDFGLLTFNHALRRYFLETRGLDIRKGMTPDDLLPPEYAKIWPELYGRVLREGPFSTLYEASSGAHTLSLSLNLVRRGAEVIGISVFGGDITERRKAELEAQQLRRELAHIGRVAMMGELAASIAHELNQPLGAILSNAEAAELFMAMTPPALGEMREILADIRENDQRASEVIRRMRNLLRKHEMESMPVDLNPLVQESMKVVLAAALHREVDLRLDLDDHIPAVLGDRIQLQQVIINLVLNAMDAVVEGNREGRQVEVRTRRASGGQVEFSVTDRGPGIPPDALAHLFEPFFTTKEEGLGMGLSIARTIIESHRGRIWAENNEGAGATFRFLVPAMEVA